VEQRPDRSSSQSKAYLHLPSFRVEPRISARCCGGVKTCKNDEGARADCQAVCVSVHFVPFSEAVDTGPCSTEREEALGRAGGKYAARRLLQWTRYQGYDGCSACFVAALMVLADAIKRPYITGMGICTCAPAKMSTTLYQTLWRTRSACRNCEISVYGRYSVD
jgi:hypothetical protein